MNFPSQMFFNDVNHDYRAAILNKNPLWLLPFYMAVATSCAEQCNKMRRTMRQSDKVTIISKQIINGENQWTGFYMISASVTKGLNFHEPFPCASILKKKKTMNCDLTKKKLIFLFV